MDFYARCIDRWERKLATRDTNRKVRDFEWGLDWLSDPPVDGNNPQALHTLVSSAVKDSDCFFSYDPPRDFRLDGSLLTFTSPRPSPYDINNRVHADFFPVERDGSRAVVVLPQWNAGADGHAGLCRLLNRFGIASLRVSLAYHDRRMPPELERADYHVSSNLGRTIAACRQSVVDVRACLDWLEGRGYRELGIVGTSLGSCIAFIAAAHDARLRAAVFNHVSMYFSDVVWTGLSTSHIRESLTARMTQEQLREYWAVISPAAYLDRLRDRDLRSLLIWAPYDTCFLPVYSRQVLDYFRKHALDHEVFTLPCGHYTTGRFPFNVMDGLAICNFLRRKL
ncbi:MAG: alpha/beta hydrolase family protein [Bryobacteraceae bacterium]